jgi:ABC-type antimicrobial peptide transport system permease subunit
MLEAPNVSMFGASTGLFKAMGLKLDDGRDFRAAEVLDSAAHVAVIGRTLARQFFPGGAVGQHLRLGDTGDLYSIIGVVSDVHYEEFMEETPESRLQVYVPYARFGWRNMSMLVRTVSGNTGASNDITAALHSYDPLIAPYEVQTMEARRDYTQWPSRVFGGLFASFGIIALVLALTGIFGVMAYTVARRRREIGVRMALGAAPLDIMRDVLVRAGKLSAIGIIIGGAAAVVVTRLLGGMLYGIDANDLRTFVAVPLLLAFTALVASYIPARRASGVDPMEALRSE